MKSPSLIRRRVKILFTISGINGTVASTSRLHNRVLPRECTLLKRENYIKNISARLPRFAQIKITMYAQKDSIKKH